MIKWWLKVEKAAKRAPLSPISLPARQKKNTFMHGKFFYPEYYVCFFFHQDNSNCKWKVSLYFLHLFSCTRYHPACSLQICNVQHKQDNLCSFYGCTRQIFSNKISSFLEFAQMRLVCSKYPSFKITTMVLCCNIHNWINIGICFFGIILINFCIQNNFTFLDFFFFLFKTFWLLLIKSL